MRLILSRKGFDSSSGGGPSPILPDGRLLSFPIPCDWPGSGTPYEGIASPDGRTIGAVMQELGVRIPPEGAHLDPDLQQAALARPAGWRPAFGQDSAAQRHLENQSVGPGDLFLFFGLFRQTELRDRLLCWQPKAPRIHALFGYLEIGDILPIRSASEAALLSWAAGHPHIQVWNRPGNTLYVAAPASSLAPGWPGAGLLGYTSQTRLTSTAPGATTSMWHLPAAFGNRRHEVSYHTRPSRWTTQADGTITLQTVGRGQEFVTDADDGLCEWARDLIADSQPARDLRPGERREIA